jgi:hypothetical protein
VDRIQSAVVEPKNSSCFTAKNAKITKTGTWEKDSFHPTGDRARFLNRLHFFEFFVLSAVKLLRLG